MYKILITVILVNLWFVLIVHGVNAAEISDFLPVDRSGIDGIMDI
jgi:hypothetical protein